MFVTAADFGNIPYSLPGLDKPGASDAFAQFIVDSEDEWLRKLVGNLFYDAMIAGVDALPVTWSGVTSYHLNDLVVYASKVWKSLSDPNLNHVPVEGANWTANPNPLIDRWLKLRDGENYQIATINQCPTFQWAGMAKMVQPLIFSLWVKTTTRANSGQGIVVASNENSELVSPGYEIVKAWNRYYKIAVGNGMANSFYGYLTARATVFDDVVIDGSYENFLTYLQNQYRSPGRMNEFDI